MTVKSICSAVLPTLILAETRVDMGILDLTLLFCHISPCPEVFTMNPSMRNLLFPCRRESFPSLSLSVITMKAQTRLEVWFHICCGALCLSSGFQWWCINDPPNTCSFTLKLISLSLAGETPNRYVWPIPQGA